MILFGIGISIQVLAFDDRAEEIPFGENPPIVLQRRKSVWINLSSISTYAGLTTVLMNNANDIITLLQFYSLESKSRWSICRTLQNTVYLIKHRAWARSKSPLLFVVDISLSLFGSKTLQLKRPEEGHMLAEIGGLLQAMMDLPPVYEYIWAEHWEEKNIRGPGTFLWTTVERLARQCLSNAIVSQEKFSVEEFRQLLTKMIAQYREEIRYEFETARAYKSHVRKRKRQLSKISRMPTR